MLVVILVVGMETHCASHCGLLVGPQGSSSGDRGIRCGLEVVFSEGGDDVGVRMSELLGEVVVVVACFGEGLSIPRVSLGESGCMKLG
ncbi:hypothetical protein NL676_013663 [Syzygium grande]|nr:hypothetical protein NL676_013663 [Syzygium grande]